MKNIISHIKSSYSRLINWFSTRQDKLSNNQSILESRPEHKYEFGPLERDAFELLYNRQKEWQAKLYDRLDRGTHEPLDRDAIVDENLYNAIEEIIEARREIPSRKYWNPKKAERAMSSDEQELCAEEIIDVMHFLMTSLIYLNCDYADVQRILKRKMGFNDTRKDHQVGE